MTRTKLYSELFNRYNRERRQFFLDCREESGRQNLRMLKKITILLVPFILFAFFFTRAAAEIGKRSTVVHFNALDYQTNHYELHEFLQTSRKTLRGNYAR